MRVTQSTLARQLGHPMDAEQYCVFNGVTHVKVELDDSNRVWEQMPPCPLIAIGESSIDSAYFDVLVEDGEQASLVGSAIDERPIASATFVQLLRHNADVSIENALFAESLSFSTLQHGQEFESWLLQQKEPRREEESAKDIVQVKRNQSSLFITLNNPRRHNAWSSAMRDAVCEALAIAIEDRSIKSVEINGNGPSFCSGGDLSEFGLARDAGVAHVSRLARSAANLLETLRNRVSVHVHGACIGAGVELPAFASIFCASEDTFFQLPEVQMGLVPGAGGTASILRRIGRHRLAWMGLTGERIDVQTALNWGLIDAISDKENT